MSSRARRHAIGIGGAIAVVLSLIPVETATDALARRGDVVTASPDPGFDSPMVFERNQGQHAGAVGYAARANGYGFGFADEAVHVVIAGDRRRPVALRLAGKAQRTSPVGETPLAGRVHYLHGQNSSAWQTDVPTFGRVRYPEVWPGVDVVFYGNNHQLEYDVEVAAGADVGAARFALDGVDSLTVTDTGELVAALGTRGITFTRPVAYQDIDGRRQTVSAAYLVDGHEVRFDVGRYDRSQPLIIDPVLVYSTFLGGNRTELGHGVAVDGAGNVYVTGSTLSLDFSTRPGARQPDPPGGGDEPQISTFITKLSRTGALVYSTYVGAADGDVIPDDIAVDGRGHAYVTGNTNAPGFPLRNAYQTEMRGGFDAGGDAFLLALSASGRALVYSTFLGGGSTDQGHAVAVTPAGEAVVVGCTSSKDFPLVNAADATFNGDPREDPPGCTGFALKMARRGDDVVYSTFLTGSSQVAYDVALDASGRAFITGYVGSDDLQTTANAAQREPADLGDGFIVRLGTDGAWQYATYLGGPQRDILSGIAIDSAGNMYVAGESDGGFPTTPGAYQRTAGGSTDAVVAQVAASGGLVWGSFLGGPHWDAARSIDLDVRGRIVIAGVAASDIPATRDAVQPQRSGPEDAFLAILRPGMRSLEYFTYLGGSLSDGANAMVAHPTGRITVAGYTASPDYPLLDAADDENACEASPCFDGFVTQQAQRQPGLLPHGSIVIHAADATAVHGRWRRVADPTTAGGFRLELPDAGAARVPAPSASPGDYFEMNAQVIGGMSGESYVLWIRGRAEGNHFDNDSVYVQYSNAMTGSGSNDRPVWQTGTARAQTIILEDCLSCGLSGWGWQDASFGTEVASVAVNRFAGDEVTIRFQAREDGISIDQLVLVPVGVNVAPGFQKDDDTLYPVGRTVTRDIVLYPGADVAASQRRGDWSAVVDAAAAGGLAVRHPNQNAAKIGTALATPTHYFELTFEADANTPYAFWVRGRADGNHWSNDSVFVQVTNTAWPIGSAAALEINLEHCIETGLTGWMWRSDTWCAAPGAPEPKVVVFTTRGTQTVRVQTREDGLSIDQIVFGRTGDFFDGPPPVPIVAR